jgi:hypothetical protein
MTLDQPLSARSNRLTHDAFKPPVETRQGEKALLCASRGAFFAPLTSSYALYERIRMGQLEPQHRFTPRMQIFADEYLSGEKSGKKFNAAAAARTAEYPVQYASRLLRHPEVKKYIVKRMEEYAMSSQEVIMRYTDLARAEIGDVVKLDPSGTRLVIDPQAVIANKRFIKQFGYDANGHPKVEFHDSVAALTNIARILGQFKDGLEVSGPGGGGVPVTMTVQFVNPDGSTANPQPNKPALPVGEEEDFTEIEEM